MLYAAYEAHSALLAPVRAASERTAHALRTPGGPWARSRPLRRLGAVHELVASSRLTHARPDYRVPSVHVHGREAPVHERVVLSTPFCSLLRFTKEAAARQPPVLLVAPLSGHFATMLRGTVRALLADHDVYVTDWHNARDVELSAGPFGADDYVAHLLRFLRFLGAGTHVVAVCQPCVPALVATSVLAQAEDPAQPASLTLMSGPIDTRVNPTKINELAARRSIDWYRRHCITTVPGRWAGAGRRVYPGFLQVSAFLAMNLRRHLEAHVRMYRGLAGGDPQAAASTREFYDEYFAVLDIAEDFYLETVSSVFQQHLLARGAMRFDGRRVEPAAIKRTALMTVEAANDDMCAPGQTDAAHALATSLTPAQRARHLQPDVGHYGIFTGRRWEAEVYPAVRTFIAAHA